MSPRNEIFQDIPFDTNESLVAAGDAEERKRRKN
jgi:hypothetical protein